MPGPIVNMGGTVTCMHGGQGQCTTVSPKVMVGSQPVVTIPASYVVAGCAFPPPPVANRQGSAELRNPRETARQREFRR